MGELIHLSDSHTVGTGQRSPQWDAELTVPNRSSRRLGVGAMALAFVLTFGKGRDVQAHIPQEPLRGSLICEPGLKLPGSKIRPCDLGHETLLEPDATEANTAQDGIDCVDDGTLLQVPKLDCSPETLSAYSYAESLFAQARYKESIEFYRTASEACPESSEIWTSYADAHYNLGEYSRARVLFRQALKVDPWNGQAFRSLADTERAVGDFKTALHYAALAIVSDPTQEIAWGFLRRRANLFGRSWARVNSDKPLHLRKLGPDGVTVVGISISMPTAEGSNILTNHLHRLPLEDHMVPQLEERVWVTYAVSKANKMARSAEEGESLSALEIEEYAVSTALEILEELVVVKGKSSMEVSPFWAMIEQAVKDGYGREAIFIHLMDYGLVEDYPDFRDKNHGRLVRYLESYVVPEFGHER